MGGESSNEVSQTTTQVLTPEQQRLAAMSAGRYEAFANSNPTLPGAAGVAGFDPLQTSGQNRVLGGIGRAAGTVSGAADANQRFTGGEFLDPDNPSTAGAIRAATRPITDTFRDVTLPGIGTEASTSGSGGVSANYGGSRHGIAQGLAARDVTNKVGDVGVTIADRARSQGLEDMIKAIGLAPTTAAAQTIPGGIESTVGDIRQGQAQRVLDAETQAKQFQQFLPLMMAQWLGQGASGLPGGSTQTVGSSTQETNPVSQLIGGASAAGSLASGAAKLLPFLMV